jgi:hypothetical protein
MNHNLNTKYDRYYIKQYSQQLYLHGGIGYSDAEGILEREGFVPLEFPHHKSFSIGAKISRFIYLLETVMRLRRNSVVVFLFPVYAKMNRLVISLLRRKGVEIICMIGDINGLKDADAMELRREIRFFKNFRYFIAHNDSMREWLEQNVHDPGVTVLEFFDFPMQLMHLTRRKSSDIVFAGNLAKSTFLEELHRLPSPLHFHLYGPGQTERMSDQRNVSWHGAETPQLLPAKLKGSFGLVWDGDTITSPGGSLGNYMKYISHHKLSLYIVSGLPLIVPCSAASAALVRKYRIGICIDNLFEINDRIDQISEEEYQEFRKNMKGLAEKIGGGGCLKEAVGALVEKIEH